MNKRYTSVIFILLCIIANAQYVQKITSINYYGDNGLAPRSLTVFNGKLYFFGTNEKVYVNKLMCTDGTEAGTVALRTIDSAKLNPTLGHLTVLSNMLIFFTPTQVWKSDGTAAGTTLVLDVPTGMSGSFHNPAGSKPATILNGKIYFPGGTGQLWVTDGTAAGTVLVKTINPTGNAFITNLFSDGSKLYFSATNGTDRKQLWVSDGTAAGTQQVKIINPTADASPGNFIAFNGKIYFTAMDATGKYGTVWVTDGTSAGTTQISTVAEAAGPFTPFNGKLYFCAIDQGAFYQLWSTDGTTAGTVVVKADYYPQSGTRGFQPFSMVVHNNKLYMQGFDSAHKYQLWMSDGTTTGTVVVSNEPGFGLMPRYLTSFQNRIVMAQYDGSVNNVQVWASDGTAGGTKMPAPPIVQATYPLYPFEGFVEFKNALYYTAAYGYFADYQLCRYSEFPAGIEKRLLQSINLYPNPATTSLQIPEGKDIIKAEIIDINGRKISEINRFENNTILLGDLHPGVYLLIMEDKNGQRFSSRFIKVGE